MFEFYMEGPFYIYKEEEENNIRNDVLEECLENCKIPFYMSTTEKCELFKTGKQLTGNLDRVLLTIDYPPNTYLA